MTIARVEGCGLVTVQDAGRTGYATVGVPAAGPLHRERYEVAATLLAGEGARGVPALELIDGSVALAFAAQATAVVVGPARCRIEEPGRVAVSSGTHVVVAVRPGQRMVVDRDGPGPVYVAVSGWAAPRVLGSAATDTFGQIGGAVVRPGFVLPVGGVEGAGQVGAFWRPVPDDVGPMRVVPVRGSAAVPAGSLTVMAASRSGVRLASVSDVVGHAAPADGPSRPVVRGAVQRTPSGEVIVLGPDGGVTGGYAVAGVVAFVDLDRLSLLADGDHVRLVPVTVDEAVRLLAQRRALVRRAYGRPDLAG